MLPEVSQNCTSTTQVQEYREQKKGWETLGKNIELWSSLFHVLNIQTLLEFSSTGRGNRRTIYGLENRQTREYCGNSGMDGKPQFR